MSRPRRDPRAEAARRVVPGGARLRSTIEIVGVATAAATGATVASSGRPRRDPRAERAAVLVAADRPRLDRSLAVGGALHPSGTVVARLGSPGAAPSGLATAAGATANRAATAGGAPSVAAAAGPAAAIRTIAAPAFLVLVVPDAPGGRAGAHDRQLLGGARLLADAGGGAVVLLADGGVWGTLGADRVLSLVGEGLASFDKIATQPSPLAGEVGGAAVGRGGRADARLEDSSPDATAESAAPPLPTLPREGGGAPNADAAAGVGTGESVDGQEAGVLAAGLLAASASASVAYDPEARAAVLVATIRALAPRHVVFAETTEGGDLARRVAAGLGEPLFAGVESVAARAVTRPAKAGKVEQRRAPPRLLSLLPDIVAAHAGAPHEARLVTPVELAAELDNAVRERPEGVGAEGGAARAGEARAGEARGGEASGVEPGGGKAGVRAETVGSAAAGGATAAAVGCNPPYPLRAAGSFPALPRGILSAETIAADPASLPLAEAGFVVSAGNGVVDFDGFRALVAALGATPGASRVVCDAGLMPRDRQVGASGTVLDATCYFAFGIAGAPQHLQGVAKCEHVVAVNTDLHAAMIERAGLAVVADAQAVIPALAALLAEDRGGATATTGLLAVPASGDPVNGDEAGGGDWGSEVRMTARPLAATLDARTTARPGADTLDALPPDPLRARVLLSAGSHPVSGRAAPVRAEAQATALALALDAVVTGLHAGGEAAVADHLGHGLDEIDVAPCSADADPLPALLAALARQPGDLVLMGRCGVGGDDSGQLPYRLAAALGLPLVADAVALAREPGRPDVLVVDQALPRGARRRVRVTLPAVVTVHPAAPPPRPFAFAAVRRGRLVPMTVEAAAGEPPLAVEERPWRRRPRLIAGASTSGTAAERLRAATEVAGGGGRLLVDPAPDEAAREILAFLRGIGVVASNTK
jgi:electron transfer flavoprotein beta subunit